MARRRGIFTNFAVMKAKDDKTCRNAGAAAWRDAGHFTLQSVSRRGWRRVASWVAFLAALIVYVLTLEPDASFWDCPEYLVTAVRLEPGHPPGNPVWTLTARVFSLFGGSDPQAIALAVNFSSALFTALAVGILASCIFILLSLVAPRGRRPLIALASAAGALCFGWSDSAWFSAVEAEVYAMSLFMTALCVRLMLGWALRRDRAAARRELLLIVYLTGLSIGIHQLNLLVIPALGLIWLFRRYPPRGVMQKGVGFWRVVLTLLLSMAAVGAILLGMMPQVISVASRLELLCVNSWGMPYHSGVILFWGLAALITWGVPIAMQNMKRIRRRWVLLAWVPAMLLTGYSSYMILLVRGAANPPMNEGAPSNIFALQAYLARDQYGSKPLFYGRTPFSRPMRLETIKEDGTADYGRIATRPKRALYAPAPAGAEPGYVLYDHAKEVIYTPELNILLPRITSSNADDIDCYADWAGMTTANMQEVEVSYALDSLGRPVGRLGADGKRTREKELRPTYLQNLRYLGAYQIYYMYMRYLLWNYAGRQNDRFATGEVEHGNFITGIAPIDDAMLGPQSAMPEEIGSKNRGRNVYFLLPLLMGILGVLYLQGRGRLGDRANFVILILFLMTGVAIVVYLNQTPREARERDYSFLGSFWAYAVWIGCGLYALISGAWSLRGRNLKWLGKAPEWLKRSLPGVAFGAATLFSLALPIWMLIQNYDDHDRSGREGVTQYAANLLNSLEPDAILFTNGDNYTFPLWWAQEVAGIRRDVTIVNTAYLATPWYVAQLMRAGEESSPLAMQARPEDILYGDCNVNYYVKMPLIPSSMDSLAAEDALTALRRLYASKRREFRTATAEESGAGKKTADKQAVNLPAMLRVANPVGDDDILLRASAVASGSSYVSLKQLAAFDIIASNAASERPRPVYWYSQLPSSDFAGFYPLTSRALYTRRLTYAQSPADSAGSPLDPAAEAGLLDQDLKAGLATLSGKRSEADRIYADATFGPMITSQRFGLLRLGGRLLKAGRYADAQAIARVIESRFPADEWEYQIIYASDSACYEGVDLARLLIESARGLHRGDTAALAADEAYRDGMRLLDREYERHRQWQAYRRALPARFRNVMAPKNIRKSVLPARIDSIRSSYGIRN